MTKDDDHIDLERYGMIDAERFVSLMPDQSEHEELVNYVRARDAVIRTAALDEIDPILVESDALRRVLQRFVDSFDLDGELYFRKYDIKPDDVSYSHYGAAKEALGAISRATSQRSPGR